MRKLILFVCFLATAQRVLSADAVGDEQRLWELEHAYWLYVEHNDLVAYSRLWHEDFVGWPYVSSVPVHKDGITDWITSQTSKGLSFKAGDLKPAALKVTGDVAFVCYWITTTWMDKQGQGVPHTVRISKRNGLADHRRDVHGRTSDFSEVSTIGIGLTNR